MKISGGHVLRSSFPVLLTSFVNKSGSIGLNLLPILIVQAHFSTAESALAMSAVKFSGLMAILVAGALADGIGLRPTLLLAFFCAALGLSFLPLRWGWGVFVIAGVLAQMGITAVNSTMRLVLTQSIPREHQKEALGWMRSVNNLGQIVSFSLAALAYNLGASLLIWFDAATSFAALLLGTRLLPHPSTANQSKKNQPQTSRHTGMAHPGKRNYTVFLGCTLILLGWNFMYEFYMAGVAGKLQVLFPQSGLRYFSSIMVINTVLCAALAVPAARILRRPAPTLFSAILLTGSGLWLGIRFTHSFSLLCLAAFCVTLGEVAYGAFGQYLLIQTLPSVKRENLLYSAAIWTANLGKISAAALVFPFVIQKQVIAGGLASWLCIGMVVGSLMVLLAISKRLPQ